MFCGPASIVKGVIDEYPNNFLGDTGASMSIFNETSQQTHFPTISLSPGGMNATSATGDPVYFKGRLLASLRIGTNVAFQDCYIASGFQHDCVLGTNVLTQAGITIHMSVHILKWNLETTFLATDPLDSVWEISLLERVDVPHRSESYTMLPIGPGCSTGFFEMADSLYHFLNV